MKSPFFSSDREETVKQFFALFFFFVSFKAVLCLSVNIENFLTFVLQYAHEDLHTSQVARLQVPSRPQC